MAMAEFVERVALAPLPSGACPSKGVAAVGAATEGTLATTWTWRRGGAAKPRLFISVRKERANSAVTWLSRERDVSFDNTIAWSASHTGIALSTISASMRGRPIAGPSESKRLLGKTAARILSTCTLRMKNLESAAAAAPAKCSRGALAVAANPKSVRLQSKLEPLSRGAANGFHMTEALLCESNGPGRIKDASENCV